MIRKNGFEGKKKNQRERVCVCVSRKHKRSSLMNYYAGPRGERETVRFIGGKKVALPLM